LLCLYTSDFNHYAYCELRLINKNDIGVFFEAGSKIEKEYVDSSKKPIIFKTFIDAVNAMSRAKWELWLVYVMPDGPHYILRRSINTMEPIK
jgi:hypothetical protein